MKRILLPFTVLIAAAICSCQSPDPSRGISRCVTNGAADIDMAAIAETAWDRLYVFPPYSSEETVTNALQCAWADYRRTGIRHDDTCTLLVFTKNGSVTEWTMHGRGAGDFAGLYRSTGYSRAEARFRIIYSGADKRATIVPNDKR